MTTEISHPTAYTIQADPATITQLASQNQQESLGKLLSYTITATNRSITFFVIDEKPLATLPFRNQFNATEYFFLFGNAKLKTTIDRQVATCQGIDSFYNEQAKSSYDITTAPLTPEEATALNELLTSSSVKLHLSPSLTPIVLISNVTSEVSSRPDEKIRISFNLRFNDNSLYSLLPSIPQIFTPTFSPPFT